jgi:hypothetical protein
VADSERVAKILLAELNSAQQRLDGWTKSASFSKPRVRSRPDPTFKTWCQEYVEKIAGLFVARLNWNLRAIWVLCDQGLAVQAQPVLRSAVESTIDLRYISTNPQTLVTKWCLFEEVERYKFWRDKPANERPSDYGFADRQVAKRLEMLDRHLPMSGERKWKLRDLARDWDLSNLAERDRKACEALGADEPSLYGFYKLLSGTSHGGAQAATDFVLAAGEGKFHLVAGIEHRKRVFVPWLALLCCGLDVASAARCGADFDREVGPDWDNLGITAQELTETSIADFEFRRL